MSRPRAQPASPRRRKAPPSPAAPVAGQADALTVQRLVDWFRRAARDLPWRTPPGTPRDPYHALVSEAMLQQTQVSRVVEYFPRFLALFPTVRALAEAPEQRVLSAWAGLGYYRRARNLHAAAKAIVANFAARVPADAADLRTLPGVGRYTAGAIASMVFGRPEPAVDGNVVRVMLRLHGQDLDPADRATTDWVWTRAGELARAAAAGAGGDVGAWNEGLMELGATVCLPPPARPACEACPLRAGCAAANAGTQHRIPRPKPRAKGNVVLHAAAVVITDAQGRVLLEQRPATGLWASMWQAPTLDRDDRAPTPAEVAEFARIRGCAGGVREVGAFTHQTTHRRVEFVTYVARAAKCLRKSAGRAWVRPADLSAYALSNAQKRALRDAGVSAGS
jgi:A/G-specific adenine glycosylase